MTCRAVRNLVLQMTTESLADDEESWFAMDGTAYMEEARSADNV